MHEYSIVEQLVDQVGKQLREQGVDAVSEIHLRRDSTFSAEALKQAYEMLVPNTPLQNAKLVIEEKVVEHVCPNCGKKESITHDDLLGHMYVCPDCGASEEIDEAHGLEIVKVIS